jgi:uncharacterized protein with von Willebrand factor type A (vWA) domain
VARHRYRAWDGAQAAAPLAPDVLLERLGERFLERDVGQVLNDVLHRGLSPDDDGRRLAGLDELRGALRQQLGDVDPAELEPSTSTASEALSDEAGDLLREMSAHPQHAGRLLAGAQAGLRDELSALRAPGGPLQASDELAKLLELAELDLELRRVRRVEDVADVPFEQIAAALGEDLAAQFAALAASLADFGDQGYIDPARSGLSAQALRRLGLGLLQDALSEIESRIAGDHPARQTGAGLERADTTRSYRFGDPFDLDLSGTVLQAVRRAPGTPVRLRPGDMTIFEREETARVAMVLAIDRSRSMGERGYLLAAKRLALSLTALIHTRYPRDRLDLLTFSNAAETVTAHELAELQWERYAVGTNIHDALVAGRRKLADARGLQRTLLLITDGEPTAYRDRSGEVRYSEPPSPEALALTYAAARQLRRDRILLVVALLAQDKQTVTFAEEVVKQAAGRLVPAEPEDLGVAMLLGYRGLRQLG